jgi:RimJ/RimL family protein N-acetyltransferase
MTPTRVGPLVFGADKVVAEFVRRRVPYARGSFDPCAAIGVIRGEKLVGGVVYYDYLPDFRSIEVAFAFDTPRWATPTVLRAVCKYPFDQLGCVRVTAIVAKKNKRSRQMVEHIGFRLEGVARKGFLVEDACIYGLLRPECRWLKDNNEQAKSTGSARAA